MPKKTFVGKVVSNKMQKTIVVSVEMPKLHPIYKKLIKNTRRFKARTNKELQIGEIVTIRETKPFSKEVTWEVVENLEKKKNKMVQVGTHLNVADNSGAKKLKVIGIPYASSRKTAYLGDIITASVVGASAAGTVVDHSVVRALIIRTKKEVRRKDGSYIRFDDNAAVVINNDKLMIGTRVFGPIAREIRDAGHLKIASLAKEVW